MWFLFPRGDEKLLCCNAFDFSMFWDGVLPSQGCLFLSVLGGFLITWESSDHFGQLIDRLHLHVFAFSQHNSVIHLFCSSFYVRENYFWQLFLGFFFLAGYWQLLYIQWLYSKIEDIFNTHFVPFIICFCMWNRSYWK